ncbi:MAG: response regulator transcription factor [Saccharospirillaceae bacterium]|nr:response regulator transcription factor [Saccharospirillaceae bacterium]MCD8531460.1 response regulator transcription factor [Saccharospirillaceae bacterium]
MKILIADDELPLLSFLKRGLESEGYEVVSEHDVHNLIASISREVPQIAVLDRMFGNIDSLILLQSIKRLPSPPMVLLLTAMDDVSDRVDGLRQGADDYLCKPFDFEELLARVQALGRRASQVIPLTDDMLRCGSLTFSREERIVRCASDELQLTRLEYDVLIFFAENAGKVLSRERILQRVWQSEKDPLTNIVDVYVSRMRQKLSVANDLMIETLRGNGYRLTVISR